MIHQVWRLSEVSQDNLGLACTDQGLVLGRTPLIELRANQFAVRARGEIERLLSKAYKAEIAAERLMPGLATVASALNANDRCLARIAAVHLRIPDLPNRAACDAMEVEDDLIKSIDWNPALHPRTGAPPNPGWFAPTEGGRNGESFSTRTAQNDDPTLRSDAGESIGEQRLVLPPGKRNDELASFLEWIANAKPADQQAIRSEIKRYYYDTGDISGGDALNAALSNVLAPGITYKDRQKILDDIGPYSQADEDDQRAEFWIGLGLLLSGMLAPPTEVAEATVAAWELSPFERGWFFDGLFRKSDLHQLSRTIDDFIEGNAISIKSLDLNAATYQDSGRLMSRLDRNLNKLEDYEGTNWGGDEIASSEIVRRTLHLIIPRSALKSSQSTAIWSAHVRAMSKGIDLTITKILGGAMLYHLYLRKGTVFVPAVGRVDKGLYRDIEPVEVVLASDTEGLHRALRATIVRGNPPTGPYPRTPGRYTPATGRYTRGTYPPPVVLKYAGFKSWYAFARGTQPWTITDKDGTYQIVGKRNHPNGWVDDPDHTFNFPLGTTLDEVIGRMIAIVQEAARLE